MSTQPQETLAGRYRLVEVVGRGGMSTVYRAVDARLRRRVAVKVLSPALAEGDPASLERFEREARAAAALNHSGVVAVYDTGVDEGRRFIVMEYVAGRSLAEILRDHGALEPERAVYIGERVADALGAAHAAGIVHRDVKPGNVMIAEDGTVKVLDFGIARALDATALTQTAAVPGTAAYMSPEQAAGKPADQRSDIYSLGALLYAMLTGTPPFTAEASPAVLHQHLHAEPPSPRAANPSVPPALDALVVQMLAKSPDDRPQSAWDVRDRLAEMLTGAPVALAETAATAQLGEEAATRMSPAYAGTRQGRAAPFVAALLAAALVIAAIIALASSGSSPHATQTPSRTTSTAPATSTPAATSRAPTTTSRAPTTPAATTTAPAAPTTPNTTTSGQGTQPPGQAKKPGAKK